MTRKSPGPIVELIRAFCAESFEKAPGNMARPTGFEPVAYGSGGHGPNSQVVVLLLLRLFSPSRFHDWPSWKEGNRPQTAFKQLAHQGSAGGGFRAVEPAARPRR